MTISYREREADRDGKLVLAWRADHSEGIACAFRGVFYTEEAARHAVSTHTCEPFTGWGYKFMGIAELLWVELDRVVDEIKGTREAFSDEQLHKLQGRAQGVAYALVLVCKPYYEDEKAISQEAAARWKMRNGQMDYRHTPGFKYDPPIPGTPRYKQEYIGTTDGVTPATYTQEHNKATQPVATSGRRRRAAVKTEKVLTEVEKGAIRKVGGTFPVKDLAGMYDVSEATINAVLASG